MLRVVILGSNINYYHQLRIMKNLYSFVFILLTSYFCGSGVMAQEHHHHEGCSHVSSFRTTSLSDTLDVLTYDIHLNQIDFDAKEIKANCILGIKAKIAGLNQISLELKDLQVTEVLYNGQSCTFEQKTNRFSVNLPEATSTENEFSLNVTYEGAPFSEDWGGFHFNGEYAFNLGVGFESDPHNLGKTWFPCVDDFRDRAMYKVSITAPEGKMGVSGGLLTAKIAHKDGRQTYVWEMQNTLPTYLVSCAVGNYELYNDTYQGINGEDIPITIYAKPHLMDKVASSFEKLKEVIQGYEEWFGQYPWCRVGYVSTKTGAMEHATNIAYPTFAINGNDAYESLYSHELAHMWFGDLVTCASAEDMWMNEGWAVFCEILYNEKVHGRAAFLEKMKSKHYNAMISAHVSDGGYFALHGMPTNITYGKTTYDKGGTVVQALRTYMGDEKFFSSVKSYLQHFAYNDADAYQMRDYLSEVSGIDLTDFFDTYIFTAGTPHYSISHYTSTPSEGQFKVNLTLRKKHKGADYIGKGHLVNVSFLSEDNEVVTKRISFDGASDDKEVMIDFDPVAAMIDFDWEMGDATSNAFYYIKEAGSQLYPNTLCKVISEEVPENDSAFVRIAHHYVGADPLPEELSHLKINTKHYWKVDGNWADTYQASIQFSYSKYKDLDKEMIQSENDSVVLLYRPDATAEWAITNQSLTGTYKTGKVYANDIKTGEYVLSVIDRTTVSTSDLNKENDTRLQLYPNPSKGQLFVELPEKMKGDFMVYNTNGVQCYAHAKTSRRKKECLNLNQLEKGTYILRFISEDKLAQFSTGFVVE